jgi:hypothetical protein
MRFPKSVETDEFGFPLVLATFPPEALVSVISGARMSNENHYRLEELLSRPAYGHIEKFRAHLSLQYYRVEIRPWDGTKVGGWGFLTRSDHISPATCTLWRLRTAQTGYSTTGQGSANCLCRDQSCSEHDSEAGLL